MADEPTEDMNALRAEYEAKLGKKPFTGWDAETLRQKMAEAPEPAPQTKRIVLLGDHVYLPEDPTQPDWEMSTNTRRYEGETEGRRTKLDVHHELADHLVKRRQAETLD